MISTSSAAVLTIVVRLGILVGALGQIDDISEAIDDPIRAGEIDSTCWKIGDYVDIRLHDNLYLDA